MKNMKNMKMMKMMKMMKKDEKDENDENDENDDEHFLKPNTRNSHLPCLQVFGLNEVWCGVWEGCWTWRWCPLQTATVSTPVLQILFNFLTLRGV